MQVGNIEEDFISPVFVAHGGGPMPLLGDKDHKELVEEMKTIPKMIKRPKAILVISAHWEEKKFTLLDNPNPELLFDYYGFPEETYQYKYKAQLASEVNTRIKSLFKEVDLELNLEKQRGFDHGVFVPLLLMYPEADIPVTQLSLRSDLDPESHLNLGDILEPLTREGVLILGSGLSFHNMRGFFNPNKDLIKANEAFQNYLTDSLINQDYDTSKRIQNIINWDKGTNGNGRLCHPREEHLLPLIVTLGAIKGNLSTVTQLEVLGYKVINVIFDYGKKLLKK